MYHSKGKNALFYDLHPLIEHLRNKEKVSSGTSWKIIFFFDFQGGAFVCLLVIFIF